MQQGNTIPVAALLLSFDLCLPAGLNGTRHSTGMLYEKSNEIKDNEFR